MCRWLAYSGRPVYLDQLLFKPERSLINQSLRAFKSQVATNGDGFGVGWYMTRPEPGLYRDYRPAWNDENLRSMAEQIQARLFFAHVRASTGSTTSRANCHPFRHGRWLFMHNGQIGGFDAIARELDFALDPALYRARLGTTDSETFFLLALSFGLEADPLVALAQAAGFVEDAMQRNGIGEPLRLTAALTDGERVFAVRYSSDRASPSLFFGGASGVRDSEGHLCVDGDDDESLLVVSEPLDRDFGNWTAVPEAHAVVAEPGGVLVKAFTPARREHAAGAEGRPLEAHTAPGTPPASAAKRHYAPL
jgi:predicted glutamine amidotransferase